MILIITKINYTESTNGWALIEIWGDMLLRGYLGSICDIGQGSNHYVQLFDRIRSYQLNLGLGALDIQRITVVL